MKLSLNLSQFDRLYFHNSKIAFSNQDLLRHFDRLSISFKKLYFISVFWSYEVNTLLRYPYFYQFSYWIMSIHRSDIFLWSIRSLMSSRNSIEIIFDMWSLTYQIDQILISVDQICYISSFMNWIFPLETSSPKKIFLFKFECWFFIISDTILVSRISILR